MGVLVLPEASEEAPTSVGWDAESLGIDRPVARARRWSCSWIHTAWGLPDLADRAEVVVGELCANAVRHGGGLASLELLLGRPTPYCPMSLRILVGDFRPAAEPVRLSQGDCLQEHGRGLLMVHAMTLGWGWHTVGDQKRVWCKLAV